MKRISHIIKAPLFRITSLNSVSVVLKILIGLVSSKVIAVYVGPTGMALVGNLRNFMGSLETVATLGFQNGIVKYVAENDKQQQVLKKIIGTVFISIIAVALVLSVLLFFLAGIWNAVLFGANSPYEIVFKVLAAAFPWYAASIALIAVINGLSKFKEVIYITIIGNIVALVVSVFMILNYGTLGALLSVVLAPSLVFFVAVYFVNREIRLIDYLKIDGFSFSVLRKMGSYSLMALVSSVLAPVVFVAVRNYIITSIGSVQAGYWEAITRISTYYLMFITTIITVYFLPKLVKAANSKQTSVVIWSYYKRIMPLYVIALLLLFFLKDIVIRILFTAEFEAVRELFFWQLSGDVLRGFSLILGYNLIAKKHTTVFIVTEFISMAILYFAGIYLVGIYGVKGIVIAHFFTYLVYLIVLVYHFRMDLWGRDAVV